MLDCFSWHLERHQLMRFRQVDKAGLANIKITIVIPKDIRTKEIDPSSTKIANQGFWITFSLFERMLIKTCTFGAWRLAAICTESHYFPFFAALRTNRTAYSLLLARSTGFIGYGCIKTHAVYVQQVFLVKEEKIMTLVAFEIENVELLFLPALR